VGAKGFESFRRFAEKRQNWILLIVGVGMADQGVGRETHVVAHHLGGCRKPGPTAD